MIIQSREGLTARFDALDEREVQALADETNLKGWVHAVLRNGDGEISVEAILENLVTLIGNQYYGERATGFGSPPAQSTGMKLGTGTTAPAATGAGAALVTYKTASNALFATGPLSSNPSGGIRRMTWTSSWAAGTATDTALAEAVIVNDAATNATSTAANTYSRVLLSPTINKGASDTLDLTWQHDLGA